MGTNQLKRFAWHHKSFRLLMCFAGKLTHSRSVSLMFDHFLFCICCNFGIPTLCKMSLQSSIFLCDQLYNQVSLPFPRGIALLHQMKNVSTHLLATSKEWFLAVFQIWHSTGSFCCTFSFPVHMFRLYAYTRLILNKLFILNVSCECCHNISF